MKIFNPYKARIPKVDSMKITKDAFKKMNLYASIVSEIICSDKECLGALLNHQNKNDNITRDVYLWKDQTVTSISGLPGEVQDAYDEATRRGMNVTGFWHSHGGISVFHSSDDDQFLSYRHSEVTNKIITGEKEKGIECIIEGETTRLFEKGSNKEIKIKGKIEDVKCIERDEYNVLNSIVINKNSYSGGYTNPVSEHDYNAEIWVWDKKAKKEFKNANLELVEETNNILLDGEELVKEVGEKVKFQDYYLKDLPNYQPVLEKYKKGEESESLEQTVEEYPAEDKKKIPLEEIIPQRTGTTGNGYYKSISDFYTVKKNEKGRIVSTIGLLGEILSGDYYENGQRYWLWEDRIKKAEEIYGKIKGSVCKEQHVMLGDLLDILNVNYYARKKHGKKLSKMCKKMGFKGKVKVKKSKGIFSRIFGGFKK